jgi:hypothetical protein
MGFSRAGNWNGLRNITKRDPAACTMPLWGAVEKNRNLRITVIYLLGERDAIHAARHCDVAEDGHVAID